MLQGVRGIDAPANRSRCSVADSLADMTLIQAPVACGTASPATNPINYPVPDAPLFARSFIQNTFCGCFYRLSLTVRWSCSPVSIRHRNQFRMYVRMSILNQSLVCSRRHGSKQASKFIRQNNIMTILIQDVNNTMAGYQKEILP